jgi:hypothetical protein
MTVFWDVASCSLVEVYQHFRGACDIVLMVEAASTPETFLNSCPTAQSNIPDDSHLHTCCRENLKSQLIQPDTNWKMWRRRAKEQWLLQIHISPCKVISCLEFFDMYGGSEELQNCHDNYINVKIPWDHAVTLYLHWDWYEEFNWMEMSGQLHTPAALTLVIIRWTVGFWFWYYYNYQNYLPLL